MEQWQAHYCDGKHNLDCIIENHYGDNDTEQPLKMCIDGVTFYGMDFDDWELSENESAANIDIALHKFLLFKYGSKEAGYRFMLQSYTLSIKIPTYSYSLKNQCRIFAELEVVFSIGSNVELTGSYYLLDGEKVCPGKTACKSFRLLIGNEIFEAENPSTFFETSFLSVCKQINGKYYLCNCFGCLYADYSPYGQSNMGTMLCFFDVAEKYLQVNGKYGENLNENECTIWDVINQGRICQEVGLCDKFVPRVDCLGGYRGLIYT